MKTFCYGLAILALMTVATACSGGSDSQADSASNAQLVLGRSELFAGPCGTRGQRDR